MYSCKYLFDLDPKPIKISESTRWFKKCEEGKLALRHLQYKVSSLSIPLEYLVIALTQNLRQSYLYLQSKPQCKHSSPISNVVTAIWHIYNYLVYLSLFDMSDHKLQISRERIANITHNQSFDQCKMKVHIRSIQYESHTGKFLSEALIFASTNPQYDNTLFIELLQYMKIPSSNLGTTCCVQNFFLTFRKIFVHNMFSPSSAKRRGSDKDLPVFSLF